MFLRDTEAISSRTEMCLRDLSSSQRPKDKPNRQELTKGSLEEYGLGGKYSRYNDGSQAELQRSRAIGQ